MSERKWEDLTTDDFPMLVIGGSGYEVWGSKDSIDQRARPSDPGAVMFLGAILQELRRIRGLLESEVVQADWRRENG